MKKVFVSILLPGDADTATLFDGFPAETLYVRDDLSHEEAMDSENMDEIGRVHGRAINRRVRFCYDMKC